MRTLHSGRSLRGKTLRLDLVLMRYHCLVTRSVMKRQPELVVQTFAAVNVCWLSFLTAWYMVACTFVRDRRIVDDTSISHDGWLRQEEFYFCGAWSASGCGLTVSIVRPSCVRAR